MVAEPIRRLERVTGAKRLRSRSHRFIDPIGGHVMHCPLHRAHEIVAVRCRKRGEIKECLIIAGAQSDGD